MFRDILVKLEQDGSRDSVRDYAVSVAETFDAHLVGVAFAHAAVSGLFLPDIPSGLLEDVLAESTTAARRATERFQEAINHSLPSAEHRLIMQGELGPPQMFSEMARCFDLSVLMQSDHKTGAHNDTIIEAVLFASGRPLIVVPYIHKDRLKLERIVCCWDASPAAARAIHDALPLLKKAQAVELLIVADHRTKTKYEARAIELSAHLARHGLRVEVEIAPAADLDIADVILSRAADYSASMIVMGSYGHSRLRELMLGGVTREMLATMTVPVFMSH